MTSRGTKYWASGAIPLIGPDILGNIISTLADIAIVISSEGEVLSVLANPAHEQYSRLDRWEGSNFRDFLTVESVPKFDRALGSYLGGKWNTLPMELNHRDDTGVAEFPINYTFHKIGPDSAILMLGRDLRPIAEMQQQLVKAQMALERDYESQREHDTRFQVLMRHLQDPVVFVSVGTGRISELNAPAAQLLGRSREALVGKLFGQDIANRRPGELMDQIQEIAQSGAMGSITVESDRSCESFKIVPTLFRAVGERLLLCRLDPAEGSAPVRDALSRKLLDLFETGADAIVMTDTAGAIVASNEAFLNMVDAVDSKSVKGRLLSDFLARRAVDLKVLLESAAQKDRMGVYNSRVTGEYGGQRAVSIAGTRLDDGQAPGFAFVIRDASVSEAVQTANTPPLEQPRPIMDLVGTATLKDIVSQTTDVIEKMCIESAIELTGNNRVASAEMLGLSRQSLYVKLRKYGLLNKDD